MTSKDNLNPEPTQFWSKVNKTATCWLWQGALGQGYGEIVVARKKWRVHQYSYVLHYGSVPTGKVIDHLCRVRHCVRPSHLEAVTNKQNVLRGEGITATQARQTHCVRGHEFSENNTYRYGNARICRECNKARCKAYKVRRKSRQEVA